MTEEITIRLATAADDAAIADVIHNARLAAEDTGFDHDYTAQETRQWREQLERENGGVIVAHAGTVPAGFGVLERVAEGVASLGVWVAPAFRRRGLGTNIATSTLDFARERGFRRIRGWMLQGESALSFLGSIGALVPLVNPNMEFELPL